MIVLEEVTKIYSGSTKAVDNLSFTVEKGEIFGLIGTSGCGKTTTLKMINRLVNPSSGQIFVGGENIKTKPPELLRRDIGYVIQDVGLFPHYTIRENISIVPKLLNWDSPTLNSRCEDLLNLVGLDPSEFSDRYPDALSGGQKQRVGFARALAADPSVILMDEPFGALDPITKGEVRGEFNKLLAQINKTIVLVTHDIREAVELCDRIGLMDGGILQQVGTPAELLFNPENKFVSQFFDADRLELEMQLITMGDLLELVPEPRPDTEDFTRPLLTIDASDSVAHLLNQSDITSEEPDVYIDIQDKHGTIGRLKAEEILSLFYRVRNKVRRAGDA
ncbi:ATP-binding cassette domain-containing protein [Aliifodinibius sp. S!AR15-10]|uniref:ABC transporter ATP-binding protein n=1 Tax=Aliifodinibius sp. S!AR15-10 TaxID=2950437 RepID=UPI002858EE85|nr:ATP-binding cassette domain-containing protein [Aliifodinibius sp. S!AR15-10]MDR8392015.1 ATP-binding cassette domain-containing protein [Aliifodinibius sp. S!AR15-10]